MFAVFVGCDGVVWDEGVAALFVARALVGWGEGGRDAVFARHVGDVDGVDARVAMLEFDGEVAVGCHVFGDGVAFVGAARNRERFERRAGRVNDEIDVGRKAACERQSGAANGEREIVEADLRCRCVVQLDELLLIARRVLHLFVGDGIGENFADFNRFGSSVNAIRRRACVCDASARCTV